MKTGYLFAIALLAKALAQDPPMQDPYDLTLDGCYPTPAPGGGDLNVLYTETTPNGFHQAARGWNTYGLQANPDIFPGGFNMNQANATANCDVLATEPFKNANYTLCSLDAGWNTNDPDEYGHPLYNVTRFNLPEFADYLHSKGLKLGIYTNPGFYCSAINSTIPGTNIFLNETVYPGTCIFDYTLPGVQEWHNSLIDLFASWGVDMVKLDFVTPGSIWNGANLPANASGAVIAYHNAIAQSSREMRLDISWKLCRNDTYLDIWRASADAMRIDQDLNNGGSMTFVEWSTVLRTIDNYRQYIALQVPKNEPLTIYPDMDNLFIANPASVSGVTDGQRYTMMNQWLGAGANLILGSDLTNLDDLGITLLTSSAAIAAADFAAKYPIQPRNPGTGQTLAQQLQAWIGGPDHTNWGSFGFIGKLWTNATNKCWIQHYLSWGSECQCHIARFGYSGKTFRML